MAKRYALAGLLASVVSGLLLAGGCGPSTELTGTPIPNALPETRVTGRPPDVIEAGFIVQFYWTGFDPDGRIERFQWKISNNGVNGISVQDTLTHDPVTGMVLNPWFETTVTDSVFFVSADLPNFPGDPEGVDRSFQTHTFWVRAVDNRGGVDPTPAHISFTSTTLLPVVTISGPARIRGQDTSRGLPQSPTIRYQGADPDFITGLPTKVRFLWKRAYLPSGDDYLRQKTVYDQNVDYYVPWDDPEWSDWVPFPRDEAARSKTYPPQTQWDTESPTPIRIHYLFAIQVQDTAGAVSIGRGYGQQVANIFVDVMSPRLSLSETYLGRFEGGGVNNFRTFDIAAGQPIAFNWSASADEYAGTITGYRYGWNITNVDDVGDLGWALTEGMSAQHRRTPVTSFTAGVHRLTVQARDNSDQISRWEFTFNVVPVPDPAGQLPLLLVDDVYDRYSQNWQSDPTQEGGAKPLDRDDYRDLFWLDSLSGSGGVYGWNPELHTIDTTDDDITYRMVVDYRNLVWIARYSAGTTSAIGAVFRPTGQPGAFDIDKYVWLTPYQRNVGNLLMAGAKILTAFLTEADHETPIVFESREVPDRGGFVARGSTFVRRSFGELTNPDGTVDRVGLSRYAYATMGISLLDMMSPAGSFYEFNTSFLVNARRKSPCAGLKGIKIDPDFKTRYMPSGGVFADAIYTEPTIGWRDEAPDNDGRLLSRVNYSWGDDEFYNADVIARNTPWSNQRCQDPQGGGEINCVEPMFRTVARYNWIYDRRRLADPDDTWPAGYYTLAQLNTICGANALNAELTSVRTNDRVTGYINWKTAPNKPSQVGDVVLGFDPYRFDHVEMRKVIRWVLGQHFGEDMNP